jgi:hypothetical protein
MGFIDLKSASQVASTGGDGVDIVGTAFGVPSCLVNLAKDALALLPSIILFLMGNDIQDGKDMAEDSQKSVKHDLRLNLGIMEFDGQTGQFTFISSSSKNKSDRNFFDTLSDVAGYAVAAAQLGANLYEAGVRGVNAFRDAKNCINSYKNYLKYKNGNAGAQLAELSDEDYNSYINNVYSDQIQKFNEAQEFIDLADNQLKNITDILSERAKDPNLEPKFSCESYNFLSGTRFGVNCAVIPEDGQKTDQEIFRLVYGPPRSTFGQFILSNDGIYFDSQTSGISPALTYLNKKSRELDGTQRWKMSHAANLGGRGEGFSTKDLELYVRTVLDPDIIDEDFYLREFYDKDGFLQELINNKNKRIYDLSSQITQLESDTAPDSVIFNFRQSLISENALHQQKINKRKKQIELAVKLPVIYGTAGKDYWYAPGEVPVNDFSYLVGTNIAMDMQKQKAMMFSQVDIDSVVLPIELQDIPTTIVKPYSPNSSLEHLLISELGDGAIIYDGSSVSSTDAVILPAEHFITTESIIAMYNFLDTTVEEPSSTSYTLRNAASVTDENYAQLVSDSPSSIYKSGLGIAYLNGITKHSNTSPAEVSGLGSYVKLPNVKKFNDLMYNRAGATIDFWVNADGLTATSGYDNGNVSSLYRLVLANENTGYLGAAPSGLSAVTSYNDNAVKGLLIGFTRDVRLTKNEFPTNITNNNTSTSSVFFIAPTQSLNLSSVSLIDRSNYDSGLCEPTSRYHSMIQRINQTTENVSFSSCQNQFCHVAITLDPVNDEIKFYLDGVNTTTSSLSYVFGIPKYSMPNIPTFRRGNTFEYSTSTVNQSCPDELKYGPKLDRYFTPWIVGGGYTDGMYQYGNFLGGQYGGVRSGLNGYLGSLKFYSRPLSASEIINNYKAHEGFFKNINISQLS